MRIAGHAMDGLCHRFLITVGAAIAAFSLIAAGSGVAAAHAAARSTDVTLVNSTGCDLTRTGYSLDHGQWSTQPPILISYGGVAQWRSESAGFMTGTEGHAMFWTTDCDNRADKQKSVDVHWNNPFYGSNSYDGNGTELPFWVHYDGGGGNNASVTFYAEHT